MDCSLPSSSVSGIFQARILEWVAISFPGDIPDPGIKPRSPALQADPLPVEPPGKPVTKYDPLNKDQKDERSKLITYGIIDDLYILFLFLNFFLTWPISKAFIEFVTMLLLFHGSLGFCFACLVTRQVGSWHPN